MQTAQASETLVLDPKAGASKTTTSKNSKYETSKRVLLAVVDAFGCITYDQFQRILPNLTKGERSAVITELCRLGYLTKSGNRIAQMQTAARERTVIEIAACETFLAFYPHVVSVIPGEKPAIASFIMRNRDGLDEDYELVYCAKGSEVITMLQMKRFKKPPKRIIMFDEEQQISGFVKTAADSCVALNAMVYAVPDAENYNKPKFFRPSEYEVQS